MKTSKNLVGRSYKADMNVKAARGQTAMTFALTNGCNAIVDMLEKHQAILDAEEACFGRDHLRRNA